MKYWVQSNVTAYVWSLLHSFERFCPFKVNFKKKVLPVHKKKVKFSCYMLGMAQRVRRVIALLFHDRGTRTGWVVSSTLRPHFSPGKDPVPILQEAGWAPGRVWTGGKSRPHRDSITDRPARSSVAIPTELPGPLCLYHLHNIILEEWLLL